MADVYRFLRHANPERYRIDPADPIVNPISLGDCLAWDAAGRFVKRLVAGNEAQFVGVAEGRHPVSSNIDNTTAPLEKDIRVAQNGIFSLNTTAAESYSHGDPVKLGADAQTIALATLTANAALVIGFIWKPQDSSATVGAAGVRVQVYLSSRFPANQTAAADITVVPAVLI